MTESNKKNRDAILEAVLADVIFDGWSMALVKKAAKDKGLDLADVQELYPGGMCDVLDDFAIFIDDKMMEELEAVNIEDLRIRDRIKEAVMARLRVMNEYKEAEKLALKHWAIPGRHLRGGKILWRVADTIWNWAGDTATDYNRYTKRGLLGGVIGSTTLIWIGDDSKGLQKTEEFLDRRIENVMQLGGALGKFKSGRFKKAV